MKNIFWIIPIVGLLPACGMLPTKSNDKPSAPAVVSRAPTSMGATMPLSIPYRTVKLTAIGYGNMGVFEGYTPGQRRLMAMRAAKLDAYRALAEQVHGVRVTGNSTVAAMVSQNDSFRVLVDAYVRGAKVASITPMAENNYETVLELELGSDFFESFNRRINAQNMASAAPDSVAALGKVGPGGAYSSNFYYSE